LSGIPSRLRIELHECMHVLQSRFFLLHYTYQQYGRIIVSKLKCMESIDVEGKADYSDRGQAEDRIYLYMCMCVNLMLV
jgi:hypothetical protein